ncbi:hypothetical protein QUA41_30575 [Microcoleus sp. Pol11C1]|uniref:hypothetical protein n=1 Tax=unclassified Microcoleus TaxID=2642155 RepID=UPI002FCEF6E2
MILNLEAIGDCFRSYIWKPPEGFSDSECLDLIEKLDTANKATTWFLNGEIAEEEFLDIKEWAHGLEAIDEFIESAEENLELLLPDIYERR